jgi:hypothetical protein
MSQKTDLKKNPVFIIGCVNFAKSYNFSVPHFAYHFLKTMVNLLQIL